MFLTPIKYFKEFDALRGIAALCVVLYHATIWFDFPNTTGYINLKKIISYNENGGTIGVRFFFVLSGFLITYLMLREKKEKTRFKIIPFYMRRLLRIWPLYFFTVFIGFIVYPYLSQILNQPYTETANWKLYLSFLTNFNSIFGGFALGILGVQWSVAIEEQFYLIWPIVFLFSKFKKIYPILVGVLIILSNVFIIRYVYDTKLVYYHTFSAINELSIGGLAAIFAFNYSDLLTRWINNIPRLLILTFYFALLFVLFYDTEISTAFSNYVLFRRPLIALLFVFLILEQTYNQKSIFKLGNSKGLSYLGKISYGIYLLHMVAIQIILGINHFIELPVLINVCMAIILTIVLSHLSYRYFESVFLKIKTRFY